MGVMFSIKPKHCQNIIDGKKTYELRRRIPNTIKKGCGDIGYIYCTKEEKLMYIFLDNIEREEIYLDGKVIGEFKARTFIEITPGMEYAMRKVIADSACVTTEEMTKYANGKTIYAIKIDDIKLYDKPLDIDEFTHCICPEMPYCPCCEHGYEYISESEAEFYRSGEGCTTEWNCLNRMKKAPQSWCYCHKGTEV